MWEKFNKIKSKLTWSLFGNIIYALSQWAIVTIIAKYGSTQELGVYSLGLAVTAPIILFFNFQLGTILATDSRNEFDFKHYFGNRIINLSIAFLVILPLSFTYNDNGNTVLVIILMGLVKYFEALSDICMGFFQKKGRIDLIGKSQFYRGILTVLVVGILFVLFHNILIAVIGLLLVMILRFFLYDLKNVKHYTSTFPIFDITWLNLTKVALPLGFVSLINSFNTNIPRYFLEYFSGISDVGIYSALSYVLTASGMIITPVSLLVGPKLAHAYNHKSVRPIIKINSYVILFSISVFTVIILSTIFQGETILKILYGNEYSVYSKAFIIINFTIFFTSLTTFFNLNIVAARFFKIQPIVNFFVTVITFITSYYFIKYNGLLGASYALLISKGAQTLFSFSIMVFAIKKNVLK